MIPAKDPAQLLGALVGRSASLGSKITDKGRQGDWKIIRGISTVTSNPKLVPKELLISGRSGVSIPMPWPTIGASNNTTIWIECVH